MNKKLISALAAVGVITTMSGCSSDSASTSSTAAAPSITLAAQTATISIADPLGTPVVTITDQPANIALAGTAITDGTDVTLSLDATNNSTRLLFNLKAVVDSISDSDTTTAPVATSTGTIDTKAFAGFGMAAVDKAATASAADAITISDADGIVDDPLLITVTLPTDHRLAVHASDGYDTIDLVDLSGSQPSQQLLLDNAGFDLHYDSAADGGVRDGVASLDGRYMYFGYRNKPSIMKFDTVDQAMTEHELIAGGATGIAGTVFAATMKVAQSSDGAYLYALVVDGAHVYNNGWQGISNDPTVSYLYKVNAGTMATVGTPLQLHSGLGADWPRPSDVDLTANNGSAAVSLLSANEGWIYLVNLSTMAISDSFDVSTTTTNPISVAINDDAGTIYFGDRNNGVYKLNVADGVVTAVTTSLTGYVHDLEIGPDGRLYYASNSGGLYALDLATDTEVELSTANITKIAFGSDGYLYAAEDGATASIHVFDISSDTQVDTDGDTTDGVAGPAASNGSLKGHAAVISAF